MPRWNGFDGIAERDKLRVNKLTTKGKIARRKLALQELTKELSNVSRACKVMDYTRQQSHEIRCNLKIHAPRGWSTNRPQRSRRRCSPTSVHPGLGQGLKCCNSNIHGTAQMNNLLKAHI